MKGLNFQAPGTFIVEHFNIWEIRTKLKCLLNLSVATTATTVTRAGWTGKLPSQGSAASLLERRHQPGPGLREFRSGPPTAGQTCSRKVPAVTTSALPHKAIGAQGSCPQLKAGWKRLLPSHRWMRWEIATSGHNKHREGKPRILREPAICG